MMRNEIKQLYKTMAEENDFNRLYMYGDFNNPTSIIWAFGSMAFAKALMDKLYEVIDV